MGGSVQAAMRVELMVLALWRLMIVMDNGHWRESGRSAGVMCPSPESRQRVHLRPASRFRAHM